MLDIGANIGNHTLYFANELHASKVISFEPVHGTFEILKKNIEINNLKDRVEIHNCGLSDKDGTASIGHLDPGNIGGTDLIESGGDMVIKTLDDFNIPKVTFMKIDVEGMEIKMLEGAIKTIKRNRPVIMIESFSEKFPMVDDFFSDLNYDHIMTNPWQDYLFYPKEFKDFEDENVENYDVVIHVSSDQVKILSQSLKYIKKNWKLFTTNIDIKIIKN